jgi:PAS domain S-box-containing protein
MRELKELRSREHLYRRILETAREGIWQVDQEGRTTMVNASVAKMLGYREDQLIGCTMFEFMEDESAQTAKDFFLRRGRSDSQRTYRFIRKDGAQIWTLLSIFPEFSAKGRFRGAFALVTDITETQRARAALNQSKQQYQAVVETQNEIICRYTPDTTLLFANDAMVRHMGLAQKSLLTRPWIGWVHPDDRSAVLSLHAAPDPDHPFRTIEFRLIHADGEYRWLQWTAREISSETNLGREFQGIGWDITEKIRAEEELRAGQERLRMAQRMTGIGMWDWNMQTNEIYWSEEAHQACKLSPGPEHMNFERFLQRVHTEDRDAVLGALQTSLHQNQLYQEEFRFHGDAEDYHWLEVIGNVVHDEMDRPVRIIGFLQDITTRKQAEEERRALESQVQHGQKLESLGILAGGIAHDFNNILTGILGNAELAVSEISSENPARQNLEEIRIASMRAADLCRQMLAYSGKGRFLIATVDLGHLVREMSEILSVSLSKKVQLVYDFAAGLPAVQADATQLRQIVMNLITNASEAVGDQPGQIRIRIHPVECNAADFDDTVLGETLPAGTYVSLSVSDTGCGMDEETKARIFDPFFTTKFAGRGLGLAAVLGIVRGHHGAIRLSSVPGKGTTFEVLLPAAKTSAAPDVQTATPPHPWTSTGRVLLADDEPTVRQVGKRMLETLGFEVTLAENGQEALQAVQTAAPPFAAIILDLSMPELDGKEALHAIRTFDTATPVLLSSGYSETELLTAEDPHADFLPKPYQRDALTAKLRRLLESTE